MPPRSIDRRQLLVGSAAVAATAAQARSVFAQGAASSSRVVVGVQGTPRTLEPVMEFSNVLWRVGYNVFESLLGIDYAGDQSIKPVLASAWKRVSPTVLELTLREGIRFHNGEIMGVEDVLFSFGEERMMGEKAPGRLVAQTFVGTIERVEGVDARTVRVVTRAPDPLLEQRLAGWGAQIVSKKGYQAAGSFDAWQRVPVGTGPFKFKQFRIDDRVVIEAHDGYHGGVPGVREVVFRVMPELASRIAGLTAGEVDIIAEVSPDQFTQITGQPNLEIVGGPIQNLRVLCYDKTNPLLADARVRRALSVSIDRKLIVDSLYGGRTRVANTFVHPSFGPLFDSSRKGTAYDPDLAKSLLRDAGYGGATIPYRTIANYYTLQGQTAQILVEMWAAVGLKVELQFRENFAQVFEAGPGRGIRDWSNTILFKDPVGALWRLYGARGPVQRSYKEWENAEFNELGAKLESTLDAAERKAIFARMLDIWEEIDPPGTTLHDLTMFYGKKKSVPWQPYPVESMDFGPANLKAI